MRSVRQDICYGWRLVFSAGETSPELNRVPERPRLCDLIGVAQSPHRRIVRERELGSLVHEASQHGRLNDAHPAAADASRTLRANLRRPPKRPAQNTAMAMYGDKDALTGGSVKTFLMQHLHEVAIDHGNGIFTRTNNYIAEIGGREPKPVC